MHLLMFNLAMDLDDPLLEFTHSWVKALAKKAAFIDVITMRAGRVEVPSNVHVYSVGKEKGYSEPRRAVEFYRHLFRVLRQGRIDVCFSHMIPIFTVLAAPVLKAKGIPIVTWYAHPSLTRTLKFAHHFSNRMVTSLPTAYPYKHDKLTVIGQGINTEIFSPDGTEPENPPMILCVGRLSPVKDHPTLLRAAALLRDRWHRPFRVVIVGGPATPKDETYFHSLHKLAKELALENIVHFEPRVPMTSLPGWYRRCMVHVNLTPTGFGDKVVWEAMSCSKPCIVANEGFIETLGKYTHNLLFRYGDPEDLVRKLISLFELSLSEIEQIGFYLREQVIRLHSLADLSDKLIDLFHDVRA